MLLALTTIEATHYNLFLLLTLIFAIRVSSFSLIKKLLIQSAKVSTFLRIWNNIMINLYILLVPRNFFCNALVQFAENENNFLEVTVYCTSYENVFKDRYYKLQVKKSNVRSGY